MMDILVVLAVLGAVGVIGLAFFSVFDQIFRPYRVGGGTVTRVEFHPTTPPVTQVETGLPLALAALSGQHVRMVDVLLDEGGSSSFEGSPPVLLRVDDRVICTYRVGRTGRRYIWSLKKLAASPADR